MNYDPNELVVVFSNVTCLALAASAAAAAPNRTISELIRTIPELNEPASHEQTLHGLTDCSNAQLLIHEGRKALRSRSVHLRTLKVHIILAEMSDVPRQQQ